MRKATIALAGNPNSGKTTLFNALTGANQYVGNWPGVTVERKGGQLSENTNIEVQDLPGIYSLSPYSLEEIVTRDYLIKDTPSVIINLVDATNLERNLYLTTQILELGRPVIVALNMVDLLEKRGITIDKTQLAALLRVPVVDIAALKKHGTKELVELASSMAQNPEARPAAPLHFRNTAVEAALSEIEQFISCSDLLKRWYAVKLFERDEKIQQELQLSPEFIKQIDEIITRIETEFDDDCESIITSERYELVTEITAQCQTKQNLGLSTSDKIDRIVTHRILALPIFFLVMWAVYYISINTVGDWGTAWANDVLFGEYIGPWVDGFLGTSGVGIGLVSIMATFASLILLFPLMLRRLHDLNMKGSWMYLPLLPFILAFIIMPNVEAPAEEDVPTVSMEALATLPSETTTTTSSATTSNTPATANEALEEASSESAIITGIDHIMSFYDSCIEGLTSFLLSVLSTIYTPLMIALGVANAVLLGVCCFKPGQKNHNDHGPVPSTNPLAVSNLKNILSLKGRTGVLTFWLQYLIISVICFGIGMLGTLELNCDDKILNFVQNAVVSGVGAVLGFLPQMAVLFLCMALLEDCGYMARVAFVMDRIFRKFGLSGKSFIPMLVSMGCGIPGVMATRTIENEKDRRMTIMLTTNMPCGAKVPIIAVLAFAFFPDDTGLITTSAYFMGLISIILSGIILKKTRWFYGPTAPFVMELPAYHAPLISNITQHSINRCKAFVQKAGTVIFFACAIIWFLKSHDWHMSYLEDAPSTDNQEETIPAINNSILADVGNTIAPVFAPLGWAETDATGQRDWKPTVAAITGLIAKEEVVATMSMLYATNDSGEEEDTAEPEHNFYAEANALSLISVTLVDTFGTKLITNTKPETNTEAPASETQAEAITTSEETEEEVSEEESAAGILRAAKALGANPITAYSFLIFNLLCAPCFAAIGAIRREMNSAKWTWLAILWLCGWAYLLAFIFYQLGTYFTSGVLGYEQIIALAGLLLVIYVLIRKPYSPKK